MAYQGKSVKKVTIHDVARQAEVSIATVSRVVNSSNYVEPETLAKVKRAIKESGYFPDSFARGMRRRKSFAIGYVVSDISNWHFVLAAKAIEEGLERDGYSLIVCSTDGDKKREANQLRLLMSKKIDGLIINVSGHNNAMVAEMSAQLPIVLISRKIGVPNFDGDYVGNDGFQGAYLLAQHILSMGHTRIGVIRGSKNISTGAERYNGFVAALGEGGVELPKKMVYNGDYYMDSGHQGARKLLEQANPPTIIVAMNNAMSLGALTYMHQQRLSIPEDVSFAAYGDIFNRELLFVNPTVITQTPRQEGKLAGELLLRRIADKNATPMTALVPSRLVVGNSIKKLR